MQCGENIRDSGSSGACMPARKTAAAVRSVGVLWSMSGAFGPGSH